MVSSKIIAVSGIVASVLGIAGIVIFLLLFPQKESVIKKSDIASQETPAENLPKETPDKTPPGTVSEQKLSALAETSWELTAAKNPVGNKTYPGKPGLFSITFLDAKRFGASSDCNLFGGTYAEKSVTTDSAVDGTIDFSIDFSTEKICKESQEPAFLFALKSASGFSLQGNALSITTRDHATLEFSPLSRQ